jgi:two-component system response regulator FlrC
VPPNPLAAENEDHRVVGDPFRAQASLGAVMEGAGLVASDPKMVAVLERVQRVAASQATVLLLGESGTGKERLAKFVHLSSPRRRGPFVALNCSAIPDTLVESTLFGHERGSFTGAHRSQAGKFEQAHGGTLFLDEVGELALAAQAKLLRVLQERCVERVGDSQPRAVDFRLVAATNVDLGRAVREGRFREDLFYRLSVFPVRVPPLRERIQDIPALARHFIRRFAADFGVSAPPIDDESMSALQGHAWPGNVRELENVIQRTLLMAGGATTLHPEHLEISPPDPFASPPPESASPIAHPPLSQAAASTPATPGEAPRNVRDVEREHILQVLRQVHGSRQAAIAILGISERTLRYKLKAYRDAGHWVGVGGTNHETDAPLMKDMQTS